MMIKNLKRAVVLGMAAITLLTATPATPAKAAELKPVHTTVSTTGKGDSLKVTYKVTLDKSVVTDGRVAVEYDPNVLELTSNSQGIKFSDTDVNKSFTDGSSKGVAYAFVSDDPKTVSGTLMTVQFTAKKGLEEQKTKIGTKVFEINNEDKAVVSETLLEDAVTVGRPKLKKPCITGLFQAVIGIHVGWTWDNNADGYELYRSTSKNGNYYKVGEIWKMNNMIDITCRNNTKYYYKVVAYQGYGKDRVYSEKSEPVSVTVRKFFGLFSW